MGIRGISQVAAGLAAVAMVTACAAGGSSGTDKAVAAAAGVSVGPTTPTFTAPPAPPPGMGIGSVTIRTRTLAGLAVPDVPVFLDLVQPCDPARQRIPADELIETLRQDGVTDATGMATFVVPEGCYRIGMAPPPGLVPLPDNPDSLFLTGFGRREVGVLRFHDVATPPLCTASAIAADLNIIGEFDAAWATISECDGHWAVIAWDLPGDTQRVIRRTPTDGWTTYTFTPHTTCWDRAIADGAPQRLHPYFYPC
ncbi:hypothetical protein [Nocardia sp. NPDC052566]|uniref:hypothetical protein n=1 Tax=Nocardia sp. NPDC052566 TaxID=3364330 RepID=UPI0037C899B0